MKKYICILPVTLFFLIFISACSINSSIKPAEPKISSLCVKYSEEDTSSSWNANSSTKTTFGGTDIRANGPGTEVHNSTLSIISSGTYVISGTLDGGKIIIEAKKMTA